MYVPTPSHLYRNRLYRKLLCRIPADPFLDVGTGFGDVALYLARRGARGVALDYGPEAVAAAAGRLAEYKRVEVVAGDFYGYEPDGSFALVTLLEILEHVEDDRGFVEKSTRMLEPGGRVLISVPARKSLWSWRDDVKGHLRRYERAELDRLIRGAGLESEVFWCWGWPFLSALRRLTGRPRLSEGGGTGDRTKVSGVRSEMNTWLNLLTNPVATFIPFTLMDLFLNGDRGVGYVVLAKKL
jgi:SAM-dependent methyltransferase